jgi:hypothetical protein
MSSFLSILAIFSAAAGILFFWIVLRRFFSVPVSLITSFLIIFGTNYFRWIFFDGATPHNFLFTLFALMVLLTLNWQRELKWIWIILMLPVTIVACFIHDLSLFILFFPLLYGLHDTQSWDEMRSRFISHRWQYIFLGIIVVISFVLTRFAWFSEPGTKFYYDDPKASVYPFLASNIQLILFSFKKGWLIYTPVMIFVLPGMYLLADKARGLFYSVFFFFISWFLLASSHRLWAADNGFGQRFFIETYAVLALPLGFFVAWAWEKKQFFRIIFLVVPFLFLILNLFQTWQYECKIIVPESMNRKVYFSIFGQTHISPAALKLMELESGEEVERIPENIRYKITRLEAYGFESPVPEQYQSFYSFKRMHSGKSSWRLSKEKTNSPSFSRPIGGLFRKDTSWIRVTAWIFFTCPPRDNKVKLIICCNHNDHAYKFFAKNFTGMYSPGKWNKIVVDYQVPSFFTESNDKVEGYFIYEGDQECFLDDFTVDLFEPNPHR